MQYHLKNFYTKLIVRNFFNVVFNIAIYVMKNYLYKYLIINFNLRNI